MGKKPNDMKNIIIRYGLISGAIAAGLMFATMPLWTEGIFDMDYGEVVGYTGMVIALSMVFLGIKSYRDTKTEGRISFWTALKIGLSISLISSVMYALAWEVCYSTFASDFTERMTEHYFQEMKEDGKTEAQIAQAKTEWDGFAEMYKNPVVRFGVSLMEILPVGILMSLAGAGLFSRLRFPAGETQGSA